MEPKLTTVDCDPQLDPYHRDTNGETLTQFSINLETGEYGLTQEYDDNATSEAVWNGRTQAKVLDLRPSESSARAYLENDAVALVQRVLDGGEVEWNGNNMVGSLDDDAQAAWETLINDLNDLPANEMALWSCEDWFAQSTPAELGITAETTDEEIETIADGLRTEANGEQAILSDNVPSYLKGLRDELAAEA